MNLYRIEFGFNVKGDELVGVRWCGTQADMRAIKKELMDGSAYDIECEPFEVPTDKAGLLAFLNEHVVADALKYKG